ncbi:hypothetical protein GCM10009007_12590 [Formosimonas limnophila]|uniref:Uncharacterized protein n=1 Tax=Formosimonas limnophila TaxID=1384487 RepID=A0A8J3CNJ4_9BURK|nr:hypothetical protein [Formosimonas limnophila]GHA73188.1 hypothetical protein GCM10009007_12590 [Formosimonas limnophila]
MKKIVKLNIWMSGIAVALFSSLFNIMSFLFASVFGFTLLGAQAIQGELLNEWDNKVDKIVNVAMHQTFSLGSALLWGFLYGFLFAVIYNLLSKFFKIRLLKGDYE